MLCKYLHGSSTGALVILVRSGYDVIDFLDVRMRFSLFVPYLAPSWMLFWSVHFKILVEEIIFQLEFRGKLLLEFAGKRTDATAIVEEEAPFQNK
jgi:hypothetical protein